MFEDHIRHAKDMIRRLKLLNGLPFQRADHVPAHQRVPTREWKEWQESLEGKIQRECSQYIVDRYQSIRRQLHDDYEDRSGLKRQRGEDSDNQHPKFDVAAEITFLERIVSLLSDLDKRSSDYSPIMTIPSPHMPAEAGHDASLDNTTLRTWDLFISYAHEDKEAIARPLYEALIEKNINVWFDEAVLELGDSIDKKINEGLARCRFGIVILSPFFLQKQWPRRELDGLVARETNCANKAIIPIWHNINDTDLMKYSPTLAGKYAARSEEGIPQLVRKIIKVLKQ